MLVDSPQTEKVTASGFQCLLFHLSILHSQLLSKYLRQHQLQFPLVPLAHQVSIPMDLETVLLNQFLKFADQVMQAMDMETVYKRLQALSLLKFVQVDSIVMEMEIVFQIQLLLHVKVDGKVMEKEDVFLYHQTSHLRFHPLKQMHVQ